MINPRYLPNQYSMTRLTDGRLSIALASAKYSELRGKGSADFEAFVGRSVAKEGACPNGFLAEDPVPVGGYVSIVIRCSSAQTQ